MKEEIEIDRVVKVDVVDASNALMGERLNLGKDSPVIVVPTDYPCPFSIYLTNRVMLLWANDDAERQNWVNCLREMIADFEQQ